MNSDLKPCPFCGGEARLTYSTDNHRQPYVTCDTPKCPGCNTFAWHYRTEAEAIEAWNRRAERTAKLVFERLEEDVKIGAGTFRKGTTVLSKCSACDGWVKPGDTYCYHCGAKLDWSE